MTEKHGNGANLGFENQMWAAADKLRGHMDASEYKHVVLGLIFLRYISDAFQAKYKQLEATKDEGLRWLSPPGDLSSEFERIAFPLDEQIEKNTKETLTLASLRDTLLPKLVSGELRVPDAEKFIKEIAL